MSNKTGEKKKRAALYTRVSTGEQSTAMQVDELTAYANNRGWEIVKIYEDQGSVLRPLRRTER